MSHIELPYMEVTDKNKETVKLDLRKIIVRASISSSCRICIMLKNQNFKPLLALLLTIGMTFKIIYLKLKILVEAYRKI